MSSDRRNPIDGEPLHPRICSRSGCTRRATFLAGVIIRNHETSAGRQVIFDLPLCAACATKTQVRDVVSDEGWEKIARGGATVGYDPRRELTRLFTCPIDDAPRFFSERYEADRGGRR